MTYSNTDYHRAAAHYPLNNFDVYSGQTPVARVVDGIYNTLQELQYLIIEFVAWEPGKQLLLPLNLVQIEGETRRLYVPSLNREQVLSTPAYDWNPAVPSTVQMRSLEQSAPLETSAPLEPGGVTSAPIPPMTAAYGTFPGSPVTPTAPAIVPTNIPSQIPPTRPPAEVAQEEVIPLQEERLIVERARQKVGEVVVRKEIETEIIQVPVQREKLIVEQVGAEPRQLAEIDLTDADSINYPQRREIQLPPVPQTDR